MSFVSYLKRHVGDHESFLGLEDDLNQAIELELHEDGQSASGDSSENNEKSPPAVAPGPAKPEGGERLTSSSKKFLAGFETFESQFKASQQDVKQISEKIADLTVAQHLTRDFMNLMQGCIYHANETELANKDLVSKNRALLAQVDNSRSVNAQLKASIEDLRLRETKVQQERDVLRSAISTANAELEEVRAEVSEFETEISELRRELSAKTSLAEKLNRENELHREKNSNLSIDLDMALKAGSEMRRKHDELSSKQKSTAAELSDVLAQLADAQKQILRLEKEVESRTSALSENTELLRDAETERDELANRYRSEVSALKAENQNLDNRFQAAAREQAAATEELISLKLKMNDVVSEKKVTAEKLATLTREIEDERRQHSVTSTKLSELNLEKASDRVITETSQQQARELQEETLKLKAEIKRLQPFERMYREKKAEGDVEGKSGKDSNEPAPDKDQSPPVSKVQGTKAQAENMAVQPVKTVSSSRSGNTAESATKAEKAA